MGGSVLPVGHADQWNHSNGPLRRSERTSRVSVLAWDVLRLPADMDDPHHRDVVDLDQDPAESTVLAAYALRPTRVTRPRSVAEHSAVVSVFTRRRTVPRPRPVPSAILATSWTP